MNWFKMSYVRFQQIENFKSEERTLLRTPVSYDFFYGTDV